MITLQTNYGAICIELDFENAPETAKNFLFHAQNGFYDGTIFHRVINGFMIQGGGFDIHMQQKDSQSTIKNEITTLKNTRGTIAMARTSDPHSATTQFFINVANNDFLNFKSETPEGWGYCVFGRVTEGLEIIDKIKQLPTTTRSGHQDVPVDSVIIEKVIVT